MQIAITKAGESLDDLVVRVYSFGRKPTAGDVRAARRSLLDQNPVLRKLPDLSAGIAVLVPPLEVAEPSGRSTEPLDVAGARALVARIGTLAEHTGAGLGADLGRDLEESRRTLSFLRSNEVKRAAAATGAEDAVAGTAEAAKQRLEDTETLRRYQQQAFARIEEDLNQLLDSFGS